METRWGDFEQWFSHKSRKTMHMAHDHTEFLQHKGNM